MTEHSLPRRTTLALLGAGGAALLAGPGAVTAQESPIPEVPSDDQRNTGSGAFEISHVGERFTGVDNAGIDVSPENFTPRAVNADGVVVGEVEVDAGLPLGFYWRPDEGLEIVDGGLLDVNSRGDAVGYGGDPEEYAAAFRPADDPGNRIFLGDLGQYHSIAYAVDDDRQILGVAAQGQGVWPVAWTPTGDGQDGSNQDGSNQDGGTGDGGGSGDGTDGNDGSEDDDGSGSEDDGASEDDGSGEQDSQQRTLRVEGTDGAQWADYEVVIDGTADPGEMANAGDEVVQNDDGTVTARGTVGGGTDTFTFTGEVVSVADVPGARYLVDGEEIGASGGDDAAETRRLRVEGTDEARWANYEITIDGTAEAVREGEGSANADDSVFENDDGTVTLAGTVGGGADTYRFTGEIASWNEATGARLTVDGEPVS